MARGAFSLSSDPLQAAGEPLIERSELGWLRPGSDAGRGLQPVAKRKFGLAAVIYLGDVGVDRVPESQQPAAPTRALTPFEALAARRMQERSPPGEDSQP